MRRVALIVSVMACSGGEGDKLDTASAPDGGAGTSTGGSSIPPEGDGAPWFCTSLEPVVESSPEGSRVSTERYELVLAVDDEAAARDMARFADAAWEAMHDWFGAEPPAAVTPLSVQLYGDVDSWADDIAAAGSEVPFGAGGYYWPPSEKAYVTPQPTVYYEYTLVLHEMIHQWHDLARPGEGGRPTWYVEGLAEYLSRHDWDGECLRMGRIPLVSQEDAFAVALDELDGAPVDVSGIVGGRVEPSRPLAMALVRHLDLSDRYGPGFDAWRDEMDAVGMSDPLTRFSELVAEPDEVGLDVAESLATEQEPMVPVFLEWWHRAPDRVDSLVWDVFSTTRLKQTPARLDVTVSGWEGDGYIGLLGAYDDDGDSMLGLLLDSAGNVSTFDVSGGEVLWADVDAVPAPGRSVVLSLTHEGGEAVFTVDGESVRIPISYAAAAGLAVYDARVLFSEITWD